MIHTGLKKYLPDKLFMQITYKKRFGKKINFKHPSTFNEKMNWLKLYDRKPIYTTLVDKYEVKKEIASLLGEDLIIPTLGIYDDVNKIDLDSLPDCFVMKCTHDSGGVSVCKSKKEYDFCQEKKKIANNLNKNFYELNREWPYKDIQPRVIIEKYLDPGDEDLYDYKFFVFNKVCKCFKIDFNRTTNHHANYYDMEQRLLPFGEVICPPVMEKNLPMPESFSIMRDKAELIASTYDIPFVRVDYYSVGNKPYFGEITLYPFGGFGRFEPNEWDDILGSWLILPGII